MSDGFRVVGERLSAFTHGRDRPETSSLWQGVALDGKDIRAARARGCRLHLVEAVRHDGVVMRETAVAAKGNEITVAPRLLQRLDLRGKVVTVDAPLAQRRLAPQIRKQGGHYLRVIKEDQPETRKAIRLLYAEAPDGKSAAETVLHTTDKGHGRREWRTLKTSSALQGWLNWPEHHQVLRRTCRRALLKTVDLQEETTYAITSLARHEVDTAMLDGF